ncbi:MFS transporter [Streptomyces venezuelae]|uniref:MFS transporter n=1 Tax=Streptomyces venezuelae TaxID=54571 RepID=A0A5P2C174_STRVZ|nr:MFS transporter [Streptomyces venezuelae]QES36466.1 MFS transporter [Streptomyces venezuelae]
MSSSTATTRTHTLARPTAGPAPRQVPALWLALLAAPVAAGANSAVLILPDMAASLGVGAADATWLVTVFAWAMAVGTPLMAGLLRRRGLGAALKLSAALIVAGTAVLAAAPWLPLAMAGRAAQAAGGAGLVTAAMSLAGSVRRMGVITAGFGTVGAVGPLLGSTVAGAASWRVALSAGAVALLALPAVMRRADLSAPPRSTPFDGRGAVLLVLTATSLVLVPRHPLPAVAAALVSAVLLALHVRARPTGFVPAALLRSRVFVPSAALACTLATSYFALLFTVPQLLRDRTDWSSSTIGTYQLVALLVGSALSMALAAAAGRMTRPRVLTILLAFGAAAPLTAVFTPWAPLLLLVATLAVFTTSAGQATLAVYATAATPTAQRPTAIGLFSLCYQLGGAFGPAVAAAIALS